ncbi:hypothetical protein [Corynebacterium sp.]|uniref:DUF6998 domain-containing protein n=1 Tax=Corynebacterium sp. TaxID=1720 RepID=UPI0019CEABF6|nr:hypothetical protein [Corynebacterium sp.]HHU67778.1 hypothetical protein [Corynebacterium sp.]
MSPRHRTAELVAELHAITAELESLYPGRRFTPDGHLVGSLGEVTAADLFDITLRPASTTGHDAVTTDGRRVEIKATYQNRGVGIRATSAENADLLIVLRLPKSPEEELEIVYNGPYDKVRNVLGRVQSNGASSISLSRLRSLQQSVPSADQVPRR